MPTVLAMQIVADATRILKDAGNLRWSEDELIGWLNAGQRAVVSRRPDANVVYIDFTCVAGTRQSLPAEGLRLVDVPCNTIGRGIRKIERTVLDNQNPAWHQADETESVEHYIYDDRVPKIFWLYPPPIAGHMVDIAHSAVPNQIVVTQGNETITIDDTFQNALLDYVLFRAFQKDAEFGASPQRAGLHWQAFLTEIGDNTKADAAMSPTNG